MLKQLHMVFFFYSDIDECSSSPCKNNGTCRDHVNTYSCLCMAGFSGRDCQFGELRTNLSKREREGGGEGEGVYSN